jgi:hypothetical protein
MMAPRATLLTYNAKDDCCFEAGYALPPLLEAAEPIFKLYGKEKSLHSHVNEEPGTHNYEKDNREAFYRMVGDHFFAGTASYDAKEIPSDKEVKTKEELAVELPANNATFHSLAVALSKDLPREPELPTDKAAALKWQQDRRKKLRAVVAARDLAVKATKVSSEEKSGVRATFWKLKVGDWTLPAVELAPAEVKATTLLLADAGRRGATATVQKLLADGQRVLALDPLYLGEAKIEQHDWLFALLLASVGDRLLGVQASQVAAVAHWLGEEEKAGPVTLTAVGPRSSLSALIAADLAEKAVGRVELHGSYGSLKDVLEQNATVDKTPELFCFGLLEGFDVKHLTALAAPRPVVFAAPSARAKTELAGLKAWYATLGSDFSPLP